MELSLVVLLVFYSFAEISAVENDSIWLSRYEYDYKMLQKIVSMEQDQKNMKQQIDKQDITNRQQQELIEQLQSEQTENVNRLVRTIKDITLVTGSTYVRWGRTKCMDNGTETIYNGYIGGSHYTNPGAAVNPLCLPQEPLWGEYDDSVSEQSYVHGTEYQFGTARSNLLFKKTLMNHNAPCSACRSTRTSVVMIPGRNVCYDGWTAEYTGYLVSGYIAHTSGTEYLCLDDDPETVDGEHEDENGKLLHITEAHCGSLTCPPYVHGRELTCVVCTK